MGNTGWMRVRKGGREPNSPIDRLIRFRSYRGDSSPNNLFHKGTFTRIRYNYPRSLEPIEVPTMSVSQRSQIRVICLGLPLLRTRQKGARRVCVPALTCRLLIPFPSPCAEEMLSVLLSEESSRFSPGWLSWQPSAALGLHLSAKSSHN